MWIFLVFMCFYFLCGIGVANIIARDVYKRRRAVWNHKTAKHCALDSAAISFWLWPFALFILVLEIGQKYLIRLPAEPHPGKTEDEGVATQNVRLTREARELRERLEAAQGTIISLMKKIEYWQRDSVVPKKENKDGKKKRSNPITRTSNKRV